MQCKIRGRQQSLPTTVDAQISNIRIHTAKICAEYSRFSVPWSTPQKKALVTQPLTTKPTKCREKTFVTRKSSKNVRQNRQTVATQNTESREKKLFVKSPVFDVGKGPVFDGGNDGGNDGGKGPVFDVEIVSTLSNVFICSFESVTSDC